MLKLRLARLLGRSCRRVDWSARFALSTGDAHVRSDIFGVYEKEGHEDIYETGCSRIRKAIESTESQIHVVLQRVNVL
jgi:hypothetical protein